MSNLVWFRLINKLTVPMKVVLFYWRTLALHKFRTVLPWCLTGLLIIVWTVTLVSRAFPDPQGTDFYPLRVGSLVLREGKNPYSPEVNRYLRNNWSVPHKPNAKVAPVVAYPLPALMTILPFTFVAERYATVVWFLSIISLSLLVIFLGEDRFSILIPFFFFPLFHGALVKTSSLLWIGIVALFLISLKKQWYSLCGLTVSLMVAKPQVGLIFGGAAVLIGLRKERVLFLWMLAWGCIVWGGSFLLMPGWVGEWWNSVQEYQKLATLQVIFPLSLLIAASAFRLKWYAILAVLQVSLFQVNDIYSSLPLLIAYVSIGGVRSCVGAGMSWLMPLVYTDYNNLEALWILVFLPFMVTALWPELRCSPSSGQENGKIKV